MRTGLPYLAVLVGLSALLFERAASAQDAAYPPPGGVPAPTAPDAPPSAPVAAAPGAPAPAPAPPPPLAPTPLGKPVIDIKVAPTEPAPERSMRMHNGFYLRLSAGALWGGTFVSSDSASHRDYNADGFGFMFDAMAGGTVSGSLAVGGAVSGSGFGQGGGSGTSGMLTVGGFVDGFPMPNEGLHLGGMLGLAGTSAKQAGSKYTGFGPGMGAWLGYDGWVADEWSMGGLLKLSGGLTWGSSHDPGSDVAQSAATYEVTLLFSVLYH